MKLILSLKKNKNLLIAIIIVLIAAIFRFSNITNLPCGLYPDQALEGLDTFKFLGGHFSPVISHKEGLFIYILTITHFLFGTGVWQIFATSALIGTSTVLAFYLFSKELFGRTVGIIAGLLLATSSWHIALSRTGFRAILVPLLICIVGYFLIKAYKSNNLKTEKTYYPLAAGAFALGFYTYNAYVFFAFGCAALIFLWISFRFENFKSFVEDKKEIIKTSTLAFATIIFPITLFVLIFPDKYFGRAGDVSIFAESKNILDSINILIFNLKETLVGIFYIGDFNWRHNPSGIALIHPFLFPFFVLSLIYAILKNRAVLALVFLFFIMLLPAVLTNEGVPPHGLRLVGIIPFLFLLSALGLSLVYKYNRILGVSVIVLATIIGGHSTFLNYFVDAPKSSHYYLDFRCDLTAASKYLESENKPIVITDLFSSYTIEYILKGKQEVEFIYIDKFESMLKSRPNNPEKLILVSNSEIFDQSLVDYLSNLYNRKDYLNKFGFADFVVFELKSN